MTAHTAAHQEPCNAVMLEIRWEDKNPEIGSMKGTLSFRPVPAHFRAEIENALTSVIAQKVAEACFVDESQGRRHVDFYRLAGMTIRRESDAETAQTALYFVEGDDLEVFNALYG